MKKISLLILTFLLASCSDTNEPKAVSVKLNENDAGDDLKLLRKDFQEQVLNPYPDVFVVVGFGLANSILIKGDKEDIIIESVDTIN